MTSPLSDVNTMAWRDEETRSKLQKQYNQMESLTKSLVYTTNLCGLVVLKDVNLLAF